MDKIFELNTGQLEKLRKTVDEGKSPVVFYAAEYNRYHMASGLGRPFLYVVGDLVSARRAFSALSEYCAGEIALFPEREDVLLPRKAVNLAGLYERIRILAGLSENKLQGVVITCESLVEYFPKPEIFSENIIRLKKGDDLPGDFAERLVDLGYKRTARAAEPAEFDIRGGAVEIIPVGGSPLRIELFGDEIEEIRTFEPENMQYRERLDEVTIYPATDIMVSRTRINGILNSLNKATKDYSSEGKARIREYAERLKANPSSPLNNYFLPFIKDDLSPISDYLSGDGVVIFDDTKQIEDKLRVLKNQTAVRVEAMSGGELLLPVHKDALCPVERAVGRGRKAGFGRITSNLSLFAPDEVFLIKANALPAFYNDMPSFFEQTRALLRNGAKIVVSVESYDVERMQKLLAEEEIPSHTGEYKAGCGVCLVTERISRGFIYPAEKIMLAGINDLSKKATPTKSGRTKKPAFEIPEKGDYVVHEKHGIGISEGIRRIKTPSGEKDYYVVLYKGGDRLYLPCNLLDELEKYGGGDKPVLHRLGGEEFARIKKRVRESVKNTAIDLLSLYRSRFGKKGHAYRPDTVWQKEMEEDFSYPETEDQLVAVAEIKRDMESGKVMDRLLCGDVGFGKTEVALRAVFKTVMEGKQAAILAPTTILAQQHYDLVKKRFDKFGIETVLLSRFVPAKEIEENLRKTRDGEADVIVATHRVLSKDVKFNDLGLLVLDEEQRFGVEDKEKLKLYRDTVNILSLSATPIPRTLNMALTGIRDVSSLEEPPKNRLPVETYVTEYDENLLKDAVAREISRGGQVFILYNRVKTIDKFYARIREILDPDIKIAVAHGQMNETVLEDRVKEFYDNKARILLSTTIIENGVDLPNANTLFVINSERMGLSQLYQLRGRVGRSDVPAYAYFTVPEGKVLTQAAARRLEALMDYTDLGSGFRVAMRDLEIRGAGNILGKEQHGQMERVGYEMYLRLMREGIDEARGIYAEETRDIELVIDGDYAVTKEYIPDERARIAFYKRISALANLAEGEEYCAYLKKSYGSIPESVLVLVSIGIMKNVAKKCGAAKIEITAANTNVRFYEGKCLREEKFFAALDEFKDIVVLMPEEPPEVVFRCREISAAEKVSVVLKFLIAFSS